MVTKILVKYVLPGLSLLAVGVAANPAFACSIKVGWTQSGAGDTGTPRFEGQCGYQASAPGDVLTHDMGSVDTYTVAFYALTRFNNGSTDNNQVKIFQALGAGDSEQISLTVRGDNTVSVAITGLDVFDVSINTTPHANGWNHYKLDWDGVVVRLSINGSVAPLTPPLDNNAVTLSKQRIGHIDNLNPNLNRPLAFDHFVSLRVDDLSQTGLLCAGDANRDGNLGLADAILIFNEFSSGGATLASGIPDYNGDGQVTLADAIAVFNAFASGQVCP